jgi:allantoinase
MSEFDLLIRRGLVADVSGTRTADVAVGDGVVAAIGPELEGTAASEIDAAGRVVLPGGLDPHVHCNDPGRSDWEGFATATRAMAAGGVTAFFDMPLNSTPPTVDGAAFDRKLEAARAACVVDFGLWGGLVPGSAAQLEVLAERGVMGIKAFMSPSGLDEFPAADDATLLDGMARCAALDLPVAVHAESAAITSAYAQRAVAEGRTAARDYLDSRPVVAELEAIGRAITFAAETGCALHVLHVSTGRGVALVAEARMRGADVTCETCPHYLALTEDDLDRLGPIAKCAPPLRPRGEQDALWEQLAAGAVDMVASDHSPCPPALKDTPDFFAAWGGISGCQTAVPLLLTEGHVERGVALETIVRLTARGAADRFGLPRKGRLEPGADADLAIMDLRARDTVQADELRYRHRVSAWVGRGLRARVERTVLRGRTVFAAGRVDERAGGRLLTPAARREPVTRPSSRPMGAMR